MSDFSEPEPLRLPMHLAAIYEVKSCLNYTEVSATYLLRQRSSGHLYLLKTASDPVYARFLSNEKQMLEHIHQQEAEAASTFPFPVYLSMPDDFTSAGPDGSTSPSHETSQTVFFEAAEAASALPTAYYIRTYIKGRTLEDICETNYKCPGVSPHRALDYLISLTELLQFLHGMDPPLIHRDIKPQNVVIDAEGICHFIDLGISRFYQPDKLTDTVVMGTRLTAPPEQFGYQQTDTRSDIYSLGILLYYCLTGEYKLENHILEEIPPKLRNIIRRATMFDPERRYQSAEELLTDLLSARYPGYTPVSRKKLTRYHVVTAVLVGLNLSLFTALIHQKWKRPDSDYLPEQVTEDGTEADTPAAEDTARTEEFETEYGIGESPTSEEEGP